MSSSALAIKGDKPLTPAMVSAIWEISAVLDEQRVPENVSDAVWLTIPTKRLRGPDAREDNVWLGECLRRMTGMQITGELQGNEWGAVLLAEWHLIEGGSRVRILVPPAGVHALRSPKRFAKIEADAVHRLPPHARRLYALLADKKRQTRQPYVQWSIPVLRGLMGVEDKASYNVWGAFRKWVLDPAVAAINDFGTVKVNMTPIKEGRSIIAVRFDWQWKSDAEATVIALENERHSEARRKEQEADDAPPLIEDEPQANDAKSWWVNLTDAERETWKDHVGRVSDVGRGPEPRPERIIRQLAYDEHCVSPNKGT